MQEFIGSPNQFRFVIFQPCAGKGECVPYYQCLNGSIITAGETLLDARLGADDDPHPEKHPCPDFFETCCLERSAKPIVAPFKPIVQPEKCGFRNDNGVVFELKPRDNEAQFGEQSISIFNIKTSHSCR